MLSICRRFNTLLFSKINISTIRKEMPHYAVAVGRSVGIFNSWPECEKQVKGFTGAKFKKFKTLTEAHEFVTNVKPTTSSTTTSYFAQSSSSSKKPKIPTFNNEDSNEEAVDEELNKIMDQLENKPVKNNSKYKRKAIMIDPIIDKDVATKRKKTSDNTTFETDGSGFTIVYTDGSCISNGTKSAKAGLGVYFGEDHPLNISEPVSGRATNNCGEIQAATKAITLAHSVGIKKLAIKTDSQFVINAITKWLPGWKKKGWKLASGEPVKNEIDFKELDNATKLMEIKWIYVKAHEGILGNERADQLAKQGAEQYHRKY